MPEEINKEAAAVVAPAPETKDEAASANPKVTVKIPQPEKKQIKQPVRKQRTLDENDPESIKAFIARKNTEHMETLENAGYKPVAVSAIVNTFMNQEKGYEKFHGRDHLVHMLRDFAEYLLYRVDRFTIDESAVLDSLFIASYADLMDVRGIFDMDPVDSKKTVDDILNSVWKRKERVVGGNKALFMQIKQFVFATINPKYVEGYAQRARYFLECINFIRSNQIEIWAGMFHDSPVRNPEFEQRDRRRKIKERPKGDPCPVCGKPMIYSFAAQKWFCPDSTCENWLPPPEKKPFVKRGGRFEKAQQPNDHGNERKPIEQKSGTDKFRAKYGDRKPVEKKPSDAAAPKQVEAPPAGLGTDWSALDKLKIQGSEPAKKDTPPQSAPATTEVVQQSEQASTATGGSEGNPE